jgi:hypothetical protein
MDLKLAAVALLAILSLAFAFVFLIYQPHEVQITAAQFGQDLSIAKKVFILMDLRNATPAAQQAIMQCGVDLAGSVALAPKNVSVLVFEGNRCIMTSGSNSTANATVSSCEDFMKSGISFRIVPGNSTAFYPNRAVIGLENYSAPCTVYEKPG